MRRKDKALQNSEIEKILQHGEYGVLSTMDEGGQPYGVPLNYVYMNDCIYCHCALAGHKLENIAINSRVSFCVVGDTCLLPEEFSTEFESVILFGTGRSARLALLAAHQLQNNPETGKLIRGAIFFHPNLFADPPGAGRAPAR